MEVANCSDFLREEWQLLKNLKVTLALGRIAFDVCLRYLYPELQPKPMFQHGGSYEQENHPLLMASYHPSRQNTQTGRLSWDAWKMIFTRIADILS
jgi:uracil-DNA glycosylase